MNHEQSYDEELAPKTFCWEGTRLFLHRRPPAALALLELGRDTGPHLPQPNRRAGADAYSKKAQATPCMYIQYL